MKKKHKKDKVCTASNFCNYRTICTAYFGCTYTNYCDYQLPRDTRFATWKLTSKGLREV